MDEKKLHRDQVAFHHPGSERYETIHGHGNELVKKRNDYFVTNPKMIEYKGKVKSKRRLAHGRTERL